MKQDVLFLGLPITAYIRPVYDNRQTISTFRQLGVQMVCLLLMQLVRAAWKKRRLAAVPARDGATGRANDCLILYKT